jgi:hypothetical protein
MATLATTSSVCWLATSSVRVKFLDSLNRRRATDLDELLIQTSNAAAVAPAVSRDIKTVKLIPTEGEFWLASLGRGWPGGGSPAIGALYPGPRMLATGICAVAVGASATAPTACGEAREIAINSQGVGFPHGDADVRRVG